MTLVKGTKPLTNVTKSSILDVARVPYTPLVSPEIFCNSSIPKESLNRNKRPGKQQQKI